MQLVWQRPWGYDSVLGFLPVMASLSVLDVRICLFFFFPKLKDECLTVPYEHILAESSREFENYFIF